jgi:hypothetical protein
MVVWSALSCVKYDIPSERKGVLALLGDSFDDSFALRRELPEPDMLIVPKKPTRFRLRPR